VYREGAGCGCDIFGGLPLRRVTHALLSSILASRLTWVFSGVRQAYLPIVASSVQTSILHYCCNDKAFAWGPVESTLGAFNHPHLHVGGDYCLS
jgi:hypothetical protein